MAIKRYKPVTNSRRNMTSLGLVEIAKTVPEKSLLKPLPKKARHGSQGKLTVRHHGGEHKRQCRVIDSRRNKSGINARVDSIQYNPNRSANTALVVHTDGEKRYIIAPKGLEVDQVIESGVEADIKIGNTLSLQNIPVDTILHNIELEPGRGGQIVRLAGASTQVLGREGKYVLIRLGSGETRVILSIRRATIGQVGNLQHELANAGKAGRSRRKGICPTVRGSVASPNDHPYGGGEDHTPIGRPSPVSPWGKPTLGRKTRHDKKSSDKLIVRRRKEK